MCSALPVYRGEIQCRELGMAIETFTPAGHKTEVGEAGELVCLKPFPCQPIGFWPLCGFGSNEAVATAEARHQQAYFSQFSCGIWCKSARCLITSLGSQLTI
jgi:acetoacetyl-CoA synthetase